MRNVIGKKVPARLDQGSIWIGANSRMVIKVKKGNHFVDFGFVLGGGKFVDAEERIDVLPPIQPTPMVASVPRLEGAMLPCRHMNR